MNRPHRLSTLRRFSANLVGAWRRKVSTRPKAIIIVNPAAGQDHPILKTMNTVFQAALLLI